MPTSNSEIISPRKPLPSRARTVSAMSFQSKGRSANDAATASNMRNCMGNRELLKPGASIRHAPILQNTKDAAIKASDSIRFTRSNL